MSLRPWLDPLRPWLGARAGEVVHEGFKIAGAIAGGWVGGLIGHAELGARVGRRIGNWVGGEVKTAIKKGDTTLGLIVLRVKELMKTKP